MSHDKALYKSTDTLLYYDNIAPNAKCQPVLELAVCLVVAVLQVAVKSVAFLVFVDFNCDV